MSENDVDRETKRMPACDGLEAAREYLESYRHGCRMLRADKYARDFFISLIRARLCSVRSFISSLGCGETGRMLLYYHYIRGIPVAECAEMLDISRAGAFRLRRRALAVAARALSAKNGPRRV